jgi:hypothetical protein
LNASAGLQALANRFDLRDARNAYFCAFLRS